MSDAVIFLQSGDVKHWSRRLLLTWKWKIILVKTICQSAMYAILYANMLYVNIFYLPFQSENAPNYPNWTQMHTAEATHSIADVISRTRRAGCQPVRCRVCHTRAASVEYHCFDFTVSMCVYERSYIDRHNSKPACGFCWWRVLTIYTQFRSIRNFVNLKNFIFHIWKCSFN